MAFVNNDKLITNGLGKGRCRNRLEKRETLCACGTRAILDLDSSSCSALQVRQYNNIFVDTVSFDVLTVIYANRKKKFKTVIIIIIIIMHCAN